MSTSKIALLSILLACWIAGLFSQFHAFETTVAYLILSMLIVAVAAAGRQYRLAYAKSRAGSRNSRRP